MPRLEQSGTSDRPHISARISVAISCMQWSLTGGRATIGAEHSPLRADRQSRPMSLDVAARLGRKKREIRRKIKIAKKIKSKRKGKSRNKFAQHGEGRTTLRRPGPTLSLTLNPLPNLIF